jgi:hypothetical protein
MYITPILVFFIYQDEHNDTVNKQGKAELSLYEPIYAIIDREIHFKKGQGIFCQKQLDTIQVCLTIFLHL